jgi:hypothetical protein
MGRLRLSGCRRIALAGGELVLPVLVTTADLKEIALQGYEGAASTRP